MAGKPFSKQVVTPKGIAQYPWLNRPDTRFNNAVYKVNLTFEGEEGEKFYQQLETIAKEALEHQKGIDPAFKKLRSLKLPIEQAEDEEGNPIDGKYVMKIKSNAFIEVNGDKIEMKPRLVDAKKQPFEGNVYGGSEIKCALQLVPYSGFGGGLTARLQAVQVLVAAQGGNNAADMFDVEEDYDTPSTTEGGDDEDF